MVQCIFTEKEFLSKSFRYVNYLVFLCVFFIKILLSNRKPGKFQDHFFLLGYFQQLGQGPLTNIQWPDVTF